MAVENRDKSILRAVFCKTHAIKTLMRGPKQQISETNPPLQVQRFRQSASQKNQACSYREL